MNYKKINGKTVHVDNKFNIHFKLDYQQEKQETKKNAARATHLSNAGAYISQRCCSGTVCHVRATFIIAAASISP